MKSSEEIVAFIDQFQAWAMERPEMYAEDPSHLESVFFVLEQVRQFAMDGKPSRYGSYLGEQGFGARCFTTDLNSLHRDLNDEFKESFRPFTDFWQGFQAWRDRNK